MASSKEQRLARAALWESRKGMKFGDLTVLGRGALGRALFQCICGRTRLHAFTTVEKGIIKSCGCKQAENGAKGRTTHGRTHDKVFRLWVSAQQRAKVDGLPFSIQPADVVVPLVCPVLGIPLYFTKGSRTDNTPSIDRIVNCLGYVKSNISVISWRANCLKKDMNRKEVEAIAKYMGVIQ